MLFPVRCFSSADKLVDVTKHSSYDYAEKNEFCRDLETTKRAYDMWPRLKIGDNVSEGRVELR